jgi:hypothetical protein
MWVFRVLGLAYLKFEIVIIGIGANFQHYITV